MNVGIIGYGSMGSMLVKGMIEKKTVPANSLFISSRTIGRLDDIQKKYALINASTDNGYVAQNSNILFVCVKPADTISVLREIKASLRTDAHIISIAGCIEIRDIEKVVNAKITRLMPSITSEVYSGVSLTCHNAKVTTTEKDRLNGILGAFGTAREIEERNFGVASELTSCAPGLFSAILKTLGLKNPYDSVLCRKQKACKW